MMRTIVIPSIVVAAMGLSTRAWAQSTEATSTQPPTASPITLADATARALAKNRDIVIERENTTIANATIDHAQAAYDPVVRGDARFRTAELPVTSLLSGAPEGELAPFQRGLVSSASVSKLLPTGGTISGSTSIARDTTNNFITLISPAWTTTLGVEVRQPLFQNRKIDPARRGIRVAQIGRERSTLSLQRTLLETVNAVEQAYWSLVSAQRDVEIRQQNVVLAEQQRTDVAARIEAKTAPEADIAQPNAEIERRKGELYAAEETRARAERALKLLMLENPADPGWEVELRAADTPDIAPAPIDLAAALKDAEQNRPELADVAARVKLQDIEIESAKDRLKPQVDLVAAYTSRGLAGHLNDDAKPFGGIPLILPADLTGGLATSVDLLARQQFPDASVGVQISIPIGNRAARADVAAAESTRRQVVTMRDREGQRIAVEVRNAVTALQTAAARLEAARAGREAAEVQLQAEQDRFSAGLTTTFLVLTRQNDLSAARVTETTALTAYRRALSELARARGTLLRDRSITVE
jgi:outer membrane protein